MKFILTLMLAVLSLTLQPLSAQKTLYDETNYNEGYAWMDVHESLQIYMSVLMSEEKCPDCGKGTVYIYFRSPSFTWESLCGTAGPLEICPYCVKQVKYIEESRN